MGRTANATERDARRDAARTAWLQVPLQRGVIFWSSDGYARRPAADLDELLKIAAERTGIRP